MIVALAPFNGEFTAGKRDLHAAFGALEPRGGHRRGARRRTAGLGEAGTALPGADRDVVAVGDMGKRDIGALGKDRMVFQKRTEAAEVVGLDVIDPEDRMRVAHADDRGRMQDRRVDRADLQLDAAGVTKLLRERNILPADRLAGYSARGGVS